MRILPVQPLPAVAPWPPLEAALRLIHALGESGPAHLKMVRLLSVVYPTSATQPGGYTSCFLSVVTVPSFSWHSR